MGVHVVHDHPWVRDCAVVRSPFSFPQLPFQRSEGATTGFMLSGKKNKEEDRVVRVACSASPRVVGALVRSKAC